jgi:hypothetical protein
MKNKRLLVTDKTHTLFKLLATTEGLSILEYSELLALLLTKNNIMLKDLK